MTYRLLHNDVLSRESQAYPGAYGDETTARYIGAEIDLLATYNFTRHLLCYGGYSHFFTGEFIRKTGPSKDSDFFYTAMQYTF